MQWGLSDSLKFWLFDSAIVSSCPGSADLTGMKMIRDEEFRKSSGSFARFLVELEMFVAASIYLMAYIDVKCYLATSFKLDLSEMSRVRIR